ncbi:MAG: hypothetical protein LBM66_00110 [Bifidobacteriaceae bacterium]|nr:hypothetical protein [Bifidobacteriaceae bacterium]
MNVTHSPKRTLRHRPRLTRIAGAGIGLVLALAGAGLAALPAPALAAGPRAQAGASSASDWTYGQGIVHITPNSQYQMSVALLGIAGGGSFPATPNNTTGATINATVKAGPVGADLQAPPGVMAADTVFTDPATGRVVARDLQAINVLPWRTTVLTPTPAYAVAAGQTPAAPSPAVTLSGTPKVGGKIRVNATPSEAGAQIVCWWVRGRSGVVGTGSTAVESTGLVRTATSADRISGLSVIVAQIGAGGAAFKTLDVPVLPKSLRVAAAPAANGSFGPGRVITESKQRLQIQSTDAVQILPNVVNPSGSTGLTSVKLTWIRSGKHLTTKTVKDNDTGWVRSVKHGDIGRGFTAVVRIQLSGFNRVSYKAAKLTYRGAAPTLAASWGDYATDPCDNAYQARADCTDIDDDYYSGHTVKFRLSGTGYTKPAGTVKIKWAAYGTKTYKLKASKKGKLQVTAPAKFRAAYPFNGVDAPIRVTFTNSQRRSGQANTAVYTVRLNAMQDGPIYK